MESPTLLTAAEAAARLRVEPETVRRWIQEGLLPAMRLPGGSGSGRLRIALGDLALVFEPARREGRVR